jgi:ABC-type cobalt transport system substrate-binding protein
MANKERLYSALGVVALYLLILFVAWLVRVTTADTFERYGAADGTAKEAIDNTFDSRYAYM